MNTLDITVNILEQLELMERLLLTLTARVQCGYCSLCCVTGTNKVKITNQKVEMFEGLCFLGWKNTLSF